MRGVFPEHSEDLAVVKFIFFLLIADSRKNSFNNNLFHFHCEIKETYLFNEVVMSAYFNQDKLNSHSYAELLGTDRANERKNKQTINCTRIFYLPPRLPKRYRQSSMKLFSALLGFSQVSAFDVNEHVEGYCKATEYVNAHPEQYSSLIARLDDDAFRTRWNVCNTNGDDILDFEENQSCAHRVAAAYGFENSLGEIMKEMMADPHIREFYGAHYNADKTQTYEQYKNTEGMSVLAGVYTIYLVHDLDHDNFLSPRELGSAWDAGKTRLHINPEMEAWVNANRGQYKRLWGMSDTDGNYRTANILELAKFQLATSQLAFEHFILHRN